MDMNDLTLIMTKYGEPYGNIQWKKNKKIGGWDFV
jgi:hypothetical protein